MVPMIHQQTRSLVLANDGIVIIIQLTQLKSQIIEHVAPTETHDKRIKFDN